MKVLRSLLALAVLSITFALFAQPAMARDQWVQVRSKNFFLVGNASEKEIRKVATRFEQFRTTFKELFRNANLTSPIPTNVVVFKSASSFKNFKPKRADGKIDEFVAGYFQPGEDVNYISLSTEGEDADMFGTIFHEYVHFIVGANFGRSNIPAWFNEGLAEYYQTFEIEEDQKVKLGMHQSGHLMLLRQNKLMPLDELFNVSNFQLLQTGNHSRSIFYAQSWALMHYLLQAGDKEGLGKFLTALTTGVKPREAFKDAFKIDYPEMEKALEKYVRQSRYNYALVTFKQKLLFDSEITAEPLSEAASNAYLGDLLYHTNRYDDAEPFLNASLKLDPASSLANTTLGMVKMRQRKFDEARTYLEKAVASDSRNHIAHFRYAYLLSREGMDEFGRIQVFGEASTAKMRDALKKAIAINPAFTESYELLAFINLVNGDSLDDSLTLLRTALKYQPGNQRYTLRIAEILVRQDKFKDAAAIAEKMAATAGDEDIRSRAQQLISEINQRKEFAERMAAAGSGSGQGGGPRLISRTDKPPTEEELKSREAEANLRSLNEVLRPLADGELRVLGHIQKIDCRTRPIVYTIKTAVETFTLTSADFQGLSLNSFDPKASMLQVGCDEDLSSQMSVLVFRTGDGKGRSRGELVSIEFVPPTFRFMTAEELAERPYTRTSESGPEGGDGGIIAAIRAALPNARTGERRQMGYLQKLECTSKGTYFHLKTEGGTLRLLSPSPSSLPITLYTPDLADLRLGCQIKPVEYPAVVVYADKPDAKAKTDGELTSIGFLPRSFTLE